MKNFLKSHTFLLTLTLCLSTTVVFWALTINQCLEIRIKEIEIIASCSLTTTKTGI